MNFISDKTPGMCPFGKPALTNRPSANDAVDITILTLKKHLRAKESMKVRMLKAANSTDLLEDFLTSQ